MNLTQPTGARVRPAVSRRVLAAFILFMITAIGFSIVAYEVRQGVTLPFDQAVLWWIHTHTSSHISNLVVVLTNVGGPAGTVLIAGGAAALLWLKRRRYAAFVVVAAVGGAAALNLVLKYLFERTRPDLWTRVVQEPSFSFPSGHAMASSALVFACILIFWQTRWRWWALAAGAVYMLAIGFTRLYLGVHYPTDIISGWIVSAGWVAVVAVVVSSYIERRRSRLDNTA